MPDQVRDDELETFYETITYYEVKKSSFPSPEGCIEMDKQNSFFLKSKQKYLHLIYKMTELIIAGNEPSDELIKAARELGRRVDIPEEELQNLGLISVH